jgi:hypothetical protein
MRSSGGAWTTVGTTGADVTTIEDSGLTPGNYVYRITPFNTDYSAAQQILAGHFITKGVAVWPPGYLVSFDGTWDFPANTMHGETDIHKFSGYYNSSHNDYKTGTGAWNLQHNFFVGAALNGAFGIDAGIAIQQELTALGTFYANPANVANIPIDVVGYSRGCMQAVLLANIIATYGIAVPGSGRLVPVMTAGQCWRKRRIDVVYVHPKIRFVGLISPVSMMGFDAILSLVPGNPQTFLGWPTSLPGSVASVTQILDGFPSQWPFIQKPISLDPGTSSSTVQTPYDHPTIGIMPDVLGSLLNAANAANAPVPTAADVGL